MLDIDILERTEHNDKFIEINFNESPFKLDENYNWILENLEANNPEIKNEIVGCTKENNDVFIKLNYNEKNYTIYKNPVIFELIYETRTIFKVYEPDQLKGALLKLKKYYSFAVNQKFTDIKTIIDLKNSNKIIDNKIILVPFILKIFQKFYTDYKLEEKTKSENDINFEIDKEILEPFFLYIEKKKIKKKIGYNEMKKFHIDLLNDKLTFILNKERRNFIRKLDDYIKIDIQTQPMIIIGNDGIGKSLTLQLYTLLKLESYKKLYFNLKLLDKCNNRDYILIESMRGFISRENIKLKDDFIHYMEFVKHFQNKNMSGAGIKQFFEILNEILLYLEHENSYGKYVIILDQFNFEKISLDDFDNFRTKIPNNENFKIIICCSLNDDENKNNLFSDYKNYRFDKIKSKIKIGPFKKSNIHIKIAELEKEIKDNGGHGTNIDNFNLIINRNEKIKEENNKKAKINIKDDNIMDIFKKYGITTEIDNIKEKTILEKNKDNKINENNIKEKKEGNKFKLTAEQIDSLNFDFPIYYGKQKTCSTDKIKIYYNNLISLEKIVDEENENKEIVECMSYFNFLPKYYYKFYLFKVIKYLEGENDITNIIHYFYEQENNNIKDNIAKFYSRLILKPKIEFEKLKMININLYQNLLKLKKCISKTYEKSIPFYKLYEYSLNFPFKYINILIENENDIIFDELLEKSHFKLRYSFPFIEKIIENMIEEYNNGDKININELSGSAYDNALELKIRENLNKLKENIEIRRVWSLNLISNEVKNEKLSEIKKNKASSKRYKDLEDITEIKDIKMTNNNYFYYKPENQDNKFFDSLFLIKLDNQEFCIIALQITKNKPNNKVKDKQTYSNFLRDNIKTKFENLYAIKISKIYLWYILSNETLENDSLCKLLNDQEIKYAFYSIKDKCFYKERNKNEIKSLSDFMDVDSVIYPQIKIQKEEDEYEATDATEPLPTSIQLFDEALFDGYRRNNKTYFEIIRYRFYGDNFGPKIGIKLKKEIIKTLKNYISYSNEFELMFLFAFECMKLYEFRNLRDNNQLIYLFKCDNKTYILYLDKCFEINVNDNSLVQCIYPNIGLLNFKREIKYNKKEIEFSDIEDIYKNNIIYLFRIYYLGKELIIKNK